MKLLIGLLVVGAVSIGASLDRKRLRLRERGSVPRPDIGRWEDEGGAIPAGDGRTAAETGAAGAPSSAPF